MRKTRPLHHVFAVVAAAVVLVPQRGDPFPDPVTHPEWARMMLHGLGLDAALAFTGVASQAFGALSWHQNAALDASQYIAQSDHGVRLDRGAPDLLRSVATPAEVSFPLTAARGGEYGLRLRVSGDPAVPGNLELAPLAGGRSRAWPLPLAPVRGWIEVSEPVRLRPGAYRVTLALPRDAVFERLELVPHCIPSIEPLGGWRATDVLDAEDLAVTLVRALGRERDLPLAEAPFETEDGVDPERIRTAARLDRGARRRVTVALEAPRDGLYSLSAFGVRATGLPWTVDGCRATVTCPFPSRFRLWFPVLTTPLSAGRHHLAVDLGPGDSVERVRLERRKETGSDYVDAVQRMGFDPGAGAVTREKAHAALAWLRRHHEIELGQTCWDLEAGLPSERPTLPPPQWSASFAEPPATVPCQPPSSPVVPDPCVRPPGTAP